MLLTILLVALPQVHPPAVPHADGQPRHIAEFCLDTKLRRAREVRPNVYIYPGDTPGASERTRRLGELPPGESYLTVGRHIGRCHYPTLIRDRSGRSRPSRR